MAYKIVLHPLAEKEFDEGYNWYEDRLEGLGNRFEEIIDKVISNIGKTPLLYPGKKNNYREAKVNTFPYLIIYKINPKKKTILISAMHHTSKNPRKKYRK